MGAIIKEIWSLENVRKTLVTDSNNLVDSLGSPHLEQEKRLRVDIATLKRDVTKGILKIKHCVRSRQVADVLTKSGVIPNLIRKVLSEGSLDGVMEL